MIGNDLRLVSGKWHETSGRLVCTSCGSTEFDLTRYSTGLLVICSGCGDTVATD